MSQRGRRPHTSSVIHGTGVNALPLYRFASTRTSAAHALGPIVFVTALGPRTVAVRVPLHPQETKQGISIRLSAHQLDAC